ncbi:hypothetical protein [Saccharothrix luteola]|uniref:hypothetical protein n=1 Tax=Saccharothrix luteola TaxID=2893018 RepID=UPI001E2D1A2F|nr:hypothetical protein [Saccharothrix luteola]MCC8248230.1 hypothetical protein [Saccharothrix luteola]
MANDLAKGIIVQNHVESGERSVERKVDVDEDYVSPTKSAEARIRLFECTSSIRVPNNFGTDAEGEVREAPPTSSSRVQVRYRNSGSELETSVDVPGQHTENLLSTAKFAVGASALAVGEWVIMKFGVDVMSDGALIAIISIYAAVVVALTWSSGKQRKN